MEHIVQFGITVDDDKIEQMIMEKTKSEITKEMYKRAWNYADKHQYEIFHEVVREVVEKNKDEIISLVVSNVSKGVVRTKVVKEAVAKKIGEDHD